MKKFKIINKIKNISLIVSCVTFLLTAISVETASLLVTVLMLSVSVVLVAFGAFLERMIVVYHRNVPYTPIFTFNQAISKEVIDRYYK